MIVTKSVSLDHKELDKIEYLIEKGKYDNFSDFVRCAINKSLNKDVYSF